jgi:hypothetical protein
VSPDRAGEPIEEIDLALPDRPTRERPYDPEPSRDKVRGYLAVALIVLLAAVVVAAWASIWFGLVTEPEVKDLLGVMLPPVVALVGSALGFYFGGKSTTK